MFSPTVSYLRSWALYRMEKISGLFEGFQRFFTTTPKRIRKYSTTEFSNLKAGSPFPGLLFDNPRRKNFFEKSLVFPPKICKLSLTEIKHIFEEDATMHDIQDVSNNGYYHNMKFKATGEAGINASFQTIK